MLRLLELPPVSCPVIGSIREAPSEKKSLAEELADRVGRNAPKALRRWASAVLNVGGRLHHGRLDPLRKPDGLGQGDRARLRGGGTPAPAGGDSTELAGKRRRMHHVFARRVRLTALSQERRASAKVSKGNGLLRMISRCTRSQLAVGPAAEGFPAVPSANQAQSAAST